MSDRRLWNVTFRHRCRREGRRRADGDVEEAVAARADFLGVGAFLGAEQAEVVAGDCVGSAVSQGADQPGLGAADSERAEDMQDTRPIRLHEEGQSAASGAGIRPLREAA